MFLKELIPFQLHIAAEFYPFCSLNFEKLIFFLLMSTVYLFILVWHLGWQKRGHPDSLVL